MHTNYRTLFDPLVTKDDLNRGKNDMKYLVGTIVLLVTTIGLFITY